MQMRRAWLTLKAQMQQTTNCETSFFIFEKNKIFHENRLSADDSHQISCLICYFRKGGKI